MALYCPHFRDLIVRPVLKEMGLWSMFAEDLLLGTCAKESRLGTFLKQLTGPALGIYQIEPDTHASVWTEILRSHPNTYKRCMEILNIKDSAILPDHDRLIYDFKYATIVARLKYLTINEPFPEEYSLSDLAKYWKKYYNTSKGKGTVAQFLDSYHAYVTYA